MATQKDLHLSSLTLTVTERCNLRCTYCTVPFAGGRAMSDEVIDAAVALLERHAADSEATLSFYGGEPMLALEGCRRAVEGARRAFDGKRRLRVMTPTNCTALDSAALDWCRDEEIELALSVDGDANETERRFADGRPVGAELMRRVPEVLAALPRRNVLARMTVTPSNVGRLAANVRHLARLGFSQIVYLVAYEKEWDDHAIALWGREHRRLGTWLIGAHGAGTNVPDLPAWRSVEGRLLGRRRGSCGAGRRIAAVSSDGGLYPCYRLVFQGDDPSCRLGDVHAGFTNHAALERFFAFDPNDVRPEDGSCAECSARDGCTHACPALGLQMLGDIARVPSIACRLMREQVAAIRPYAALARQPARRSPGRRLAAAVVAAAVTTAGVATASCGGSTERSGKSIDAGSGGAAGGDGSMVDVIGPGICAEWDGGGGVCPVQVDSGSGGSGGGICDIQPDAAEDVGGGGVGGGGGICPIEVDAGDDSSSGGVGGGGGICPYLPDSGMGGGGLC